MGYDVYVDSGFDSEQDTWRNVKKNCDKSVSMTVTMRSTLLSRTRAERNRVDCRCPKVKRREWSRENGIE